MDPTPVVKRTCASVGKPTTCGDLQPVVKRHDFGVRCEIMKGMGAAWKKYHFVDLLPVVKCHGMV